MFFQTLFQKIGQKIPGARTRAYPTGGGGQHKSQSGGGPPQQPVTQSQKKKNHSVTPRGTGVKKRYDSGSHVFFVLKCVERTSNQLDHSVDAKDTTEGTSADAESKIGR